MGDFCFRQTVMKYFIYGFVWANMTPHACRCMCAHRQTPAYLNKHTQNKCRLSWIRPWFTMWASVCIMLHHQLRMFCSSCLLSVFNEYFFKKQKNFIQLFSYSDLLSSFSLSLFTSPAQRGPSLTPSAFPNLSSFWDIPLWRDNNQGCATPSLPLCSLKRLPQLASFLMMRLECLLLSVLLSKQFPPVWPPPPEHAAWHAGTVSWKKGPGCTPNAHLLSLNETHKRTSQVINCRTLRRHLLLCCWGQ